VWTNPEA
jgi:hypothetical protein